MRANDFLSSSLTYTWKTHWIKVLLRRAKIIRADFVQDTNMERIVIAEVRRVLELGLSSRVWKSGVDGAEGCKGRVTLSNQETSKKIHRHLLMLYIFFIA